MNIIVDNFTVPIGLWALNNGHNVHMLDPSNMPIIKSFDKFNPTLCILHVSRITPLIIKCLQEKPHLHIFILYDNEEQINTLKDSVGNKIFYFESMQCSYGMWNSLHYPESKNSKEPIDAFFDGYLPLRKDKNGIRIFNDQVIDSEFYCGVVFDRGKVFRSVENVAVAVNDRYNAIASGCNVMTDLGLDTDYKSRDSLMFYRKIMEGIL